MKWTYANSYGVCSKALNKYKLSPLSVTNAKVYMMTPFLATDSVAKERYQQAKTRTRAVIERSFGRLKRRFAVLHSEVFFNEAKWGRTYTFQPNYHTVIMYICHLTITLCICIFPFLLHLNDFDF